MFTRRRPYFLALVVLLAVPAIVWAGTSTGCGGPSAPGGAQVSAVRRANNALIADVAVQLAQPASIYVEYGTDEIGWLRTPTRTAAAGHNLPLLRMLAHTKYDVRVFSLDSAGECPLAGGTTTVTTGSLPPALHQTIAASTGQASFELTLMENTPMGTDVRDRTNLLVATDTPGRVVWYYPIPSEVDQATGAATAFAIKERPNGNLLFHTGEYYGFEEITMDGRRVRYVPARTDSLVRTTNHDFVEFPDGTVLFLGREERMVSRVDGGEPRLVRGDTLNLLDLNTGAAERVWTVFDMLDPNVRTDHWREIADDAEDWTHANTVSIGPRGNIILSLRSMDQVISLSRDFKTLEWRLGGPGGQFSFPEPSTRWRS